MIIKYCEFIGDDKMDFDELPKPKGLCEYAGFNMCQLHHEIIYKNGEGWRICCESCTTPKYVQGEKQ